jgi:hypothetical protein
MFNFIFIHRAVIGYNVFQQQAKLWNIPLAVAQLIKMLSLGIVGIGRELYIEGPARGDNRRSLSRTIRGSLTVSTIACASAQASSTSLNCFLNTGDLSLGAQEYNITQHKLAEVRRQISGLNAP